MTFLLLSSLLACVETSAVTEASGPPMVPVERQCEPGVVAEVLQAGSYTYVRYTSEGGDERWMASLRTTPAVGEAAGFVRFGERKNFYSKRLNRDFDHLTFGYLGRCEDQEKSP